MFLILTGRWEGWPKSNSVVSRNKYGNLVGSILGHAADDFLRPYLYQCFNTLIQGRRKRSRRCGTEVNGDDCSVIILLIHNPANQS